MKGSAGRGLAAAALLLLATAAGCGSSGSASGSTGGGAATLSAGPGSTQPRPRPVPPTAPAPPVAASTPAALAAQIAAAETGIRDPSTPATDLPRLGQTQQVAYGRLASNPQWLKEVLGLVPDWLRPIVEANTLALAELFAQGKADTDAYGNPPERPDWTIVEPEPAAFLLAEYRAAGATTGVPWQYLAAIHFVETRTGRIRGNSVAGAQGPMQFIPSTWALYGQGGDINDTRDAIQAAARLLRAAGAPSDMNAALRAYNPSGRYVRAITAYAEQIKADERAFLGYYQWQVYYGGRLLPVGYGR